MFRWLTNNLLWTAGFYIVLVLSGTIIVSAVFLPVLLWLLLPFFLFCFAFFRNPVRECGDQDETLLVSPTDGRVLNVERKGDTCKITIFLSVFDVHVNWIPTAGVIESMTYRPGKFIVAWSPKTSDNNERHDVVIKAVNGQRIEVRQIAGLIARRICWWVSPGQTVQRGDKFGMIRFGSRVEILVNRDALDVYIKKGQYVYGGHTIIGKWSK
ncbi:phosphatidylserine decarboxylase family protein [bacterium]|jgi:phosphatidylserine decarboxylase|nr:phosphatidylserine decarboxylase family protein [bacterium]MBT5015350.1 phosphatidylserine decarboxylase family protein [bacterium]